MDSKDKNFDDFIRKSAKQTPQLPKEIDLSWEDMDIMSPAKGVDLETKLTDKVLRDAVADAPTLHPDLDLSWERMDIKTKKKKSKKRILFWFFPLLLLVGILTYLKIGTGSKIDGTLRSNEIIVNQKTNAEVSLMPELESSTNDEFAIIEENSMDQKSDVVSANQVSVKSNETILKKKVLTEQVSQASSYTVAQLIEETPYNGTVGTLKKKPFTEASVAAVTAPMRTSDRAALPMAAIGRKKMNLRYSNRALLAPAVHIPNSQELDYVDTSRGSLTLYALLGKNKGSLIIAPSNNITSDIGYGFGTSSTLGLSIKLSEKIRFNSGMNYTATHSTLSETRMVDMQFIAGSNKMKITCLHFYQNNYSHYLGLFAGVDYKLWSLRSMDIYGGITLSGSKLVKNDVTILRNDNMLYQEAAPDNAYAVTCTIAPSLKLEYRISKAVSLLGNVEMLNTLNNSLFVTESTKVNSLFQFSFGLGFGL